MNLNCIMQLKQFYYTATKVSSRKKCYYFWWSTWLLLCYLGEHGLSQSEKHYDYKALFQQATALDRIWVNITVCGLINTDGQTLRVTIICQSYCLVIPIVSVQDIFFEPRDYLVITYSVFQQKYSQCMTSVEYALVQTYSRSWMCDIASARFPLPLDR